MLDRVDLASRLLALARPFAPGLPASDALARSASLANAGLTSMAAVRLMLAVEAAFDIAIPDAELTPENFATADSIAALILRARGMGDDVAEGRTSS
jgi:acyl carrier protein